MNLQLIKNIIIGICSFFFLLFGIYSFAASYSMKNPLEFIMNFFSASLIIMISAVGIIYVYFRIRAGNKTENTEDAE